jgi:hypothetical protein
MLSFQIFSNIISMKRKFVPCPNWCFCNISDYYNKYYYYYKNPHIFFTHCTATAFCPTHRGVAAITVRTKDYRGICRLLSYMNKDEGSEVNKCCQVFANFLASVTKFAPQIFCVNFVIIYFVTYKLCYV